MSNKKKIVGSIVILTIVSIFLFVRMSSSKSAENADKSDVFVQNNSTEAQNTEYIKVCIKGGVKYPGVYSLKSESIVSDIIDKAGGFSKDADMDWAEKKLNLARKIKNEDFIYIVKKTDSDNGKNVKSAENTESTYNNDGTLDINSASSEELQKVDGIGPSTAKKIIEYREKNNGFKNIEELKNIERIGDKTFEKLKDKFVVR